MTPAPVSDVVGVELLCAARLGVPTGALLEAGADEQEIADAALAALRPRRGAA